MRVNSCDLKREPVASEPKSRGALVKARRRASLMVKDQRKSAYRRLRNDRDLAQARYKLNSLNTL